jgi:hypothetical protein
MHMYFTNKINVARDWLGNMRQDKKSHVTGSHSHMRQEQVQDI